MARLIISADDYGMHPSIDEGILWAIDHGCITSVSVAAAMVSEASMARLKARGVRIGLHVMLVDVPWNTASYHFKDWQHLFMSMCLKGVPTMQEMEVETRYQIIRMRQLDMSIAHLDSHQHTHALPPIWKLFKRLAFEYGIARLRHPHVPSLNSVTLAMGSIGLYGLTSFNATTGIDCVPCIGIPSAHGKGGDIDHIVHQLERYRTTDLELVLHPAMPSEDLTRNYGHWGIDWHQQMAMACSDRLRLACAQRGFEL